MATSLTPVSFVDKNGKPLVGAPLKAAYKKAGLDENGNPPKVSKRGRPKGSVSDSTVRRVEFVKGYCSSLSVEQMAEILFVTPATILRIAKEHGFKVFGTSVGTGKRGRPEGSVSATTSARIDRIRNSEPRTALEWSMEFGLSASNIYMMAKKYGLTLKEAARGIHPISISDDALVPVSSEEGIDTGPEVVYTDEVAIGEPIVIEAEDADIDALVAAL